MSDVCLIHSKKNKMNQNTPKCFLLVTNWYSCWFRAGSSCKLVENQSLFYQSKATSLCHWICHFLHVASVLSVPEDQVQDSVDFSSAATFSPEQRFNTKHQRVGLKTNICGIGLSSGHHSQALKSQSTHNQELVPRPFDTSVCLAVSLLDPVFQ